VLRLSERARVLCLVLLCSVSDSCIQAKRLHEHLVDSGTGHPRRREKLETRHVRSVRPTRIYSRRENGVEVDEIHRLI
jgi:hypothetical protein